MSDTGDFVIRMEGVSVRRGDSTLLESVDWTVELDERWVVLGPNGAGKTTLLRLAAADIHPSRGVVEVLGARLGRVDVFELRTRIGLSSAGAGAAGAARRGRPRRRDQRRVRGDRPLAGALRPLDTARADELLGALGLRGLGGRPYGTLSEGERKRALIARALMTDPELLLLDEPTAGLDLGGREDLVAGCRCWPTTPRRRRRCWSPTTSRRSRPATATACCCARAGGGGGAAGRRADRREPVGDVRCRGGAARAAATRPGCADGSGRRGHLLVRRATVPAR